MNEPWVVVGAGSAGCVIARRLVDAGHHVVLVEAGPPLVAGSTPAALDGPDSFAAQTLAERVEHGLRVRRTDSGPLVPYLRGRGVGGSSAINALIALRGDPALYADWGWDDTDDAWGRMLIPEDVANGDELGPVDRALLAAAPGARPVPLTRRAGRRITSAEAYLWPILDGGQLHLVTDALVDRVVGTGGAPLASGSCVGGVRLAGGDVIDTGSVVLCAGAIHTPAVLQRSGLVGAGVGDGLQDHPAVAFTLRLRRAAASTGDQLAVATVLDADPVQLLPFNHLGPAAPDDLAMLMVALMRPRSAIGTVRIDGPDPLRPPLVDFRLLDDPADRAMLRAGVRSAIDLLGGDAFAEIVEDVFIDAHGTGVEALADDETLDRWLLESGADYVHASSSCAIGRLLDPDGRVPGVDGLHVCDTSAFPRIPNANTHLPVTMLAERLSMRMTADPV